MSLRGTVLVLYFGCVIGKECPRNFYWDDVLTMCSKCDDFCYSAFNRTIHGKHICATSEQCAYKNRQISKQSCPNGTVYDPIKCTCENCSDCFSKIEIHYNCSFGAICNFTCNGTLFDNTPQLLRSPHFVITTAVSAIFGVILGLCIIFVLLYRNAFIKKEYSMLEIPNNPQLKQELDIELTDINVREVCGASPLQGESERLVSSTEATQTDDEEITQEKQTSSQKDTCPTKMVGTQIYKPSNLTIHANDLNSPKTLEDVNGYLTKDNTKIPATDLAAKHIDSVIGSLFPSDKRNFKDNNTNINSVYTTNKAENVTFYNENQSLTNSSVYDFRSTSYDETVPLNTRTEPPRIKTKGEHGHKTADEIEVLPKNLPVIPNIQRIMKYLASEVWVKRLISNGKFIRVTFDTISLKDANYLVGQNTKLPSKQYECIHISQAVKMY